MLKKVFFKVSVLSLCLGAITAQAQEPAQPNSNKFGGVDKIINSLGEKDDAKSRVNVAAQKNMIIESPISNALPVTKKEVAVAAPKNDIVINPIENSVLDTRVTEIPPGARFTFKRNLFLPSNKSGFLFLGGEPKFAIDSGADINKILLMRDEKSTPCALISNKSNIMMRGVDSDGKVRTNLDVLKMSFSTMSRPGYGERTYIKVLFSPKLPKGVANPRDNSVEIHLTCQLPKELGADYKNYRLRDINSTLNGLFDFSLPRYIEI